MNLSNFELQIQDFRAGSRSTGGARGISPGRSRTEGSGEPWENGAFNLKENPGGVAEAIDKRGLSSSGPGDKLQY